MPLDLFIAMTVFAFVMAFTPGPNNIMLTASGVNFGFARSAQHMLGVTVGFVVLLAACAAGLGLVFAAVPMLHVALKIAGGVYMLWLAWKVANASPVHDAGDTQARPLTFFQAAAFQWVNPKAVVTSLSAVAIYIRPGQAATDVPLMLAVFGLSTLLSVSGWTAFGVALRGLLANPRHARIFNAAMALLLVVSIVPMVV